jgi:hypothetical protein
MYSTRGIPSDTAAILAASLEGILYGEYRNWFVCPIPTKLGFSRLFSPHVYGYNLGFDIQPSHAGRESSDHCSGHPAVDIEYYG